MLVQEFKNKHDEIMAYYDWVSVQEAKVSGLIPVTFHEYFPDTCDCGSEFMISKSLTQCMCCNPKCPVKDAYKLAEFLKRCKCLGFGAAKCKVILNELRAENDRRVKAGRKPLFVYGSYLEAIAVDFNDYPISLSSLAIGIDFYTSCKSILEHKVTFAKLVSQLGIQSIDSNANQLFRGISSFNQFIDEVKKDGGLINYCALRGVYAPKIVSNLHLALLDIGIADRLLGETVRLEGVTSIDLCLTGSMSLNGTKLTKAQYIEVLHNLCTDSNGVQLFEFNITTAIKTAPFIVYSRKSTSRKFEAGLARGKISDMFGEHDVLITADDLFNLLTSFMISWNEKLKDCQQQSQ